MEVIKGPVWDNRCGHKKDEYVGSFEIPCPEEIKYRYYDLYVFEDTSTDCRMHTCIRYGNEIHEYMSPGHVERLFMQDGLESYRGAAELLLLKGDLKWEKR